MADTLVSAGNKSPASEIFAAWTRPYVQVLGRTRLPAPPTVDLGTVDVKLWVSNHLRSRAPHVKKKALNSRTRTETWFDRRGPQM